MATTYVKADDKVIDRNRFGRFVTWVSAATGAPILGAGLGFTLAGIFLDFPASQAVTAVVGGIAGLVGFLTNKHLFVVQNDTTGALVTLDRLKSLLNAGNVDVVYGPGTHFAYPWEQRFENNNIPVVEATNTFTFEVQCDDGILYGSGSYRLRPDFRNPVSFLSGVAAVASDLEDLIKTTAAEFFGDKKVAAATKLQPELNKKLNSVFAGHDETTGFEQRFGVQVGDVTVRELLPSKELQRTLSAVAEAEMISEGTAILLGMTKDELKAAIAAKTIDQNQLERARREFRIISGNMDNSEVKRWEVDVTGISPQIAEALTAFLSRVPPDTLKNMAGGGKSPAAKTGGKK